MIHQLRTYQIFPRTREVFLARFHNHASRIMKSYGFDFQGMWETGAGESLLFVYLLAWENEAEMAAKWQAFMADDEWAEVKQASSGAAGGAAMVGEMTDQILTPSI